LLIRHLEVLPLYERAILIDRNFHSLSPQEIARKLRLPFERVRQKEAKARRIIRILLRMINQLAKISQLI
jgi:DNA-directed RNA polymerase specialized sigma24 family protein